MTVVVRLGPTEREQESSFMNATLQSVGAVAFSVATHVDVPFTVAETVDDIAAFLRQTLGAAALFVPSLRFEVEVGEVTS